MGRRLPIRLSESRAPLTPGSSPLDTARAGQVTFGFLNLFAAIVLAALAVPLVKWLVVHGGELGLSNPGAISYCNILFVGNFLAGALILLHTRPQQMIRELRSSDIRARLLLVASIVVGGALVPVVMYLAPPDNVPYPTLALA